MINLPKTTEFNKRIPKQKFYENLNITPSIKQSFSEQIKTIFWKNKIAPTTTNIAEGKNVNEIEVFEIKLNSLSIDENVLKLIDKEIPYYILFILNYEEKYQLWIGYKEESDGNTAFKVTSYYHTEWADDVTLEMQGLDMDKVYENFIRQIAGDNLSNNDGETLKESVEKDEEKKKIRKQIETLKSKMKKEKQLNKQMELNKQIKQLMKKIAEY